jgi:hypothetical protein
MVMLIALCIFFTIIIPYCVTPIHCYLADFITQIHWYSAHRWKWMPSFTDINPLHTKHINTNVNKSTQTHTTATYLVCHAGGGEAIRIPSHQQIQNQNFDLPTKSKLTSLNNV